MALSLAALFPPSAGECRIGLRAAALPGGHNILWFEQVEQMAFGRKDVSMTI
jgi:hypothetical protein